MLLKRRADFYSVKLGLYARYGVAEYWVADLENERVMTYLEPGSQGYGRKAQFGRGDSVAPRPFADVKIAVTELFA